MTKCLQSGPYKCRIWPLLLVALWCATEGCGHFPRAYVPIRELTASPERFAGKQISIQGKVTNVLKLPFVTAKIYSIQDSTGEIVVRTDREPPIPGSVTHVEGTLENLAVVGDESMGFHVREVERW